LRSRLQGKTITPADCTAARLGDSIPVPMIGEPVRSVTLAAPAWVDAGNGTPAHCRVDGVMAPISSDATARGRSTSASCCRPRGTSVRRNWAAAA
jgi:hypothetical protein